MRRISICLLSLVFASPLSYAQTPSSFDAVFSSVVVRYGQGVPQLSNAKLSGTITYPQLSETPFTLTLQQRQLRFELATKEGLTIVRDADLAQATRESRKRHFADPAPLYTSGMNLSPILTLLYFYNDSKYARSLVAGTGGSNVLKFTETKAPGYSEAPLFPKPKLIASFLVDGNSQIQSVSYEDDRRTFLPAVYTYSYVDGLTSPLLQPRRVDCRSGDQVVYSAQITAAQVNVVIPADFFRIVK